ncbi:MAG: SDR family NAD(P)-dependent oxidoreductase [Myxococcota bacterium]|nr:SDR family NAD(P)-dependent oxidoreductase [Myxococcota bacterium]
MTLERWRDKVALVTGASAGIGAAVALELARCGFRVALTARRSSRLDALAARIRQGGGDALAIPADLRSEDDIHRLFTSVSDAWGGVDVMVNNAGLGRVAPLMNGPTEAWREMLELNILALAICTREAVSQMKRRGGEGQIIHISSMSGHRVPTGTGGMYSATKFAVRALTEALRRELKSDQSAIRVAAISPGFVETEFAAVMLGDAEAAAAVYERFPCLQPEDIARCVTHILAQPPHMEIHDVLLRPTAQPT